MPPRLTLGGARDLDPRLIRVGSLVLVRDGSADTVFHGHTEHIPVEEPHEKARAAKPVESESVDSLEADIEDSGEKMVVCPNMMANQFLLGGQPTVQQQIPCGNQPPPSSPAFYGRKRPQNANQPPNRPKDMPPRTPSTTTAVSIQEPTTSTRPSMRVGSNVASFSMSPATRWQSTFMLGGEPFPVTFSIRNWSAGEGGRIARSLRQALQLSSDVRYFSDDSDKVVVVRLKWHTIAVTLILHLFTFW